MKKKLYKNIFSLATLQFAGHCLQHMIENSDKLVALYLLPRGGGVKNFIEVYHNGILVERRDLISPRNVLLSYIFYYLDYLYVLLRYFSFHEHFYFLNSFPFFFFFNSIIRLIWRIEFVYWIGDYWPMRSLYTDIIRFLTHYYHDRTQYAFYLSDRINKIMNHGKILHESTKRTAMWGVDPPNISLKKLSGNEITLCHIGVLVEWQGIDLLLAVVAKDKRLRLKLIGTGNAALMEKYKRLIKEYGITDKVYFPNKFFYGKDLQKQIKDCQIGMALYTVDANSVTYYADPAKVKQYAEFGFPIIMTNAAGIADYITKFRAGIVVTRDIHKIQEAINKMKNNYKLYLKGLNEFNKFFSFRTYYRKIFKFMEEK